MAAGGQDFTIYQPTLALPCDPAQHRPSHLVAMPEGSQYRASGLRAGVLGWRGYLIPDRTGHNR
jgi:hypothetical protein